MSELRWERYPTVRDPRIGRAWLEIQVNLGLAHNTVHAYARALEQYFRHCAEHDVAPEHATREHISSFVRSLMQRPGRRRKGADIK